MSSEIAVPSPPPFKGEVASLIHTVRRRWSGIVESVCGGAPRAQEIADRFGVYRKLGWQIWNVVYAEDPLSAIRHLPNQRTFKVWRTAAQKKGVDQELLDKLEEAIAAFQRTAEVHADDRQMLEMLVESHADDLDEAAAARWRRQAFNGNAFTFGVRAKCMLACAIIFPSAKPRFFDMVRIQGLLGLTRTRPNVRWPFAQLLVRKDDAKLPTNIRQPLVESAAVRETGVPLLEEFCSRPLPKVQRQTAPSGILEDELLPGEVGQSAASDIVTAEILREVGVAWADEPGLTSGFGTGVRTPCELLVSDQLVHRSLYPNVTRELLVFGELMRQLSRDERDRIPVPEKIQHLGAVSDGIGTADAPRYSSLLSFVFRQTGLKPEEFDAYRVRMRYPPIPVSVVVRSEMPVATS